jgi:hypothetical protein
MPEHNFSGAPVFTGLQMQQIHTFIEVGTAD